MSFRLILSSFSTSGFCTHACVLFQQLNQTPISADRQIWPSHSACGKDVCLVLFTFYGVVKIVSLQRPADCREIKGFKASLIRQLLNLTSLRWQSSLPTFLRICNAAINVSEQLLKASTFTVSNCLQFILIRQKVWPFRCWVPDKVYDRCPLQATHNYIADWMLCKNSAIYRALGPCWQFGCSLPKQRPHRSRNTRQTIV